MPADEAQTTILGDDRAVLMTDALEVLGFDPGEVGDQVGLRVAAI